MKRILLVTIVLLVSSSASAQTAGQTNGGEVESPPLIIEGVSDADPNPEKEIRLNELRKKVERAKKLERRASDEKVLTDHRWVQDTLRRSGPLVHGLQRYARLDEDVLPHWRAGVRLQFAAHEALRQRKLHTAVYLTMEARDVARRGYAEGGVTLAKVVEDTKRERDYAAKARAEQVQAFVGAAQRALPDRELDPGKSPHTWRWKPVIEK